MYFFLSFMCFDLLACHYNVSYVVLYLSPADSRGAVALCISNRVPVIVTM